MLHRRDASSVLLVLRQKIATLTSNQKCIGMGKDDDTQKRGKEIFSVLGNKNDTFHTNELDVFWFYTSTCPLVSNYMRTNHPSSCYIFPVNSLNTCIHFFVFEVLCSFYSTFKQTFCFSLAKLGLQSFTLYLLCYVELGPLVHFNPAWPCDSTYQYPSPGSLQPVTTDFAWIHSWWIVLQSICLEAVQPFSAILSLLLY